MSNNIIALAGPPGSGKSTVGEILSCSLQADFVDIDCLIQEESKHTIEWIFSHNGEKAFRAIEKRILAEVILSNSARTVIALGGGALLNTESRALVENKTILFTLFASTETLISRNNGNRPLASDADMLKNLLCLREEHYSSLGNPVSTENKSPREVAEVVMKAALPLLSPLVRPS